MNLFCSNCKDMTRIRNGFCIFCRTNLIKVIGVPLKHYQTTEDIEAMNSLDKTKFLHPLLKTFFPSSENDIIKNALSLNHIPKIYKLSEKCARILGLETMPNIYLINNTTPNAMAFGTDDAPCIAITDSFLKILNKNELIAIMGHEMAHIKSKHLFYHTIAETLAKGTNLIGFFLGRGMISIPLRVLLLSWHRKSEVTADRAGLIVSKDINAVKSSVIKANFGRNLNSTEIKNINQNLSTTLFDKLSETFKTHPLLKKRLDEIDKFSKSQPYKKILKSL